MFLLARRSLVAHKVRLILTILAVVLGVGFVAGSYILTDSIGTAFDRLFSDVNKGVALSVRNENADPDKANVGFDGVDTREKKDLRLPESILQTVRATPGVTEAEGTVQGFAQLFDKKGKPIGGQGPPVLGFSWSDSKTMNQLTLVKGRAPRRDGEIVIDIGAASRGKLAVGDTTQVVIGSGTKQAPFKVVGLVRFGKDNALQGATLSAFDLRTAQRLFDAPGQLDIVAVAVEKGTDPTVVKKRLTKRLPDGVQVVTAQETTDESLEAIQPFIDILRYVMLAFAAIALFVGIFVIFNTFTVTVAQRTKEIGLLRCVGASRRQVVSMLLLEGLGIGAIASILGLLAGFGVAAGLRALLNALGFEMPSGELTVQLRTVLVSIAVGVGVTVISALLPAVRASRIAPIEALRSGSAMLRGMRLWVWALAILLETAGVALLAAGLLGTADSAEGALTFLGGGFALLIVGTAMLAPVLVRPFVAFLRVPLRLTGGVGTLAGRNVTRNTRRTAATAAALMIGLGLACFASVFTGSAQKTVDRQIESAIGSDLVLTNVQRQQPGAGLPPEVVDEVAAIDGVEHAVGIRFAPLKLDGNLEQITAVDGAKIKTAFTLTKLDGRVDRLAPGEMIIDQPTADRTNWKVGDKVKVSTARTKKGERLRVVGIYDEMGLAEILIAQADFNRFFPSTLQLESMVFVNYESGAKRGDVRKEIERQVKDMPFITVQDTTDIKKELASSFNQILALIYGLLFLSLIIALFGIVNTLMLSVYDRTSEIGMLRAVGMTRRQVRQLIRREAVTIAVLGALLGLLLGVGLGWAGVWALREEGFVLALPWVTLLVLVLVGILAGLAAALLPARSAGRMDVLKAISSE